MLCEHIDGEWQRRWNRNEKKTIRENLSYDNGIHCLWNMNTDALLHWQTKKNQRKKQNKNIREYHRIIYICTHNKRELYSIRKTQRTFNADWIEEFYLRTFETHSRSKRISTSMVLIQNNNKKKRWKCTNRIEQRSQWYITTANE